MLSILVIAGVRKEEMTHASLPRPVPNLRVAALSSLVRLSVRALDS